MTAGEGYFGKVKVAMLRNKEKEEILGKKGDKLYALKILKKAE